MPRAQKFSIRGRGENRCISSRAAVCGYTPTTNGHLLLQKNASRRLRMTEEVEVVTMKGSRKKGRKLERKDKNVKTITFMNFYNVIGAPCLARISDTVEIKSLCCSVTSGHENRLL